MAEEAYQQQCSVYIHLPDSDWVETVDEQLWSLSEQSFIPHAITTASDAADEFVCIGDSEPAMSTDELLISLCEETPLYFSRYKRVVEIIANDEADKVAGRQRYRFYQQRGYPLTTHTVAS